MKNLVIAGLINMTIGGKMSTRCQVKVIQEGLPWKEAITLYHHCDGYPSNMFGLFKKALEGHKEANKGEITWEMGRAGKAAGRLCWADPDQFEPESGHKLHGDIEYYYKLFVCNGHDETVVWEVHAYEINEKGRLIPYFGVINVEHIQILE
jgi:hypothetical protein